MKTGSPLRSLFKKKINMKIRVCFQGLNPSLTFNKGSKVKDIVGRYDLMDADL
jgi:hypothetical protein